MTGAREPVQPHPVAALLKPEHKDRIRATRFRLVRGACISEEDGHRCPLAVALDLSSSLRGPILSALGNRPEVISFMRWADRPDSDPADVYALLDAVPAAPPPAHEPEGGHG